MPTKFVSIICKALERFVIDATSILSPDAVLITDLPLREPKQLSAQHNTSFVLENKHGVNIVENIRSGQ